MKRKHYLIAYDICDEKRLYRIHKQIQAYSVSGQKSFYDCWVTKHELLKLKRILTSIMDIEEDRIYIFQIFDDSPALFFGVAQNQSIEPFLFI